MPRNGANLFAVGTPLQLYNEGRKWFTFMTCAIIPTCLLVINAPFGRFTADSKSSIFLLDGIKSWIFMELISPMTFLYTFLKSPLSAQAPPFPGFSDRSTILAACFFLHYLNRAIISPLRTPSRSKSHIIVPIAAIFFNLANGSLMGAYLSSPFTRLFLPTQPALTFYGGLALWAAGLAGNIIHDEILLNIRRKAKSKGKGKEGPSSSGGGEHYAIPHGLLYEYISYPNYLCEWIEWTGFAIAASPLPFTLTNLSISTLTRLPQSFISLWVQPASLFAPHFSPPWIFVVSEIALMMPRAYRGHQWYHTRFKDTYPKERKAVIPFVL